MIENPRRADKVTYTRWDIEDAIEWINRLKDIIKELEEENKKLKELSEHKTEVIMSQWKRLDELEEENRKLKSERDKWRGKYNRLKSEFNFLKNKIWTTQK